VTWPPPLPADLPSQAAAAARDTLGGAVGIADQLPEGVGNALLAAARQAFTQGMQLTVLLSAVVAVGIAVLATVLLRAVPTTAQAEPSEEPAPEPVAVAQPEESFQLIRVGSGCLACPPGEGTRSDIQSS
jgi:MFS transporter, DHA2 family, multidrug resistance protein